MIILSLQGGLGNQMFQIAHAYSMAKRMRTRFLIHQPAIYQASQGCPPSAYKETLYRNLSFTTELPTDWPFFRESVFGEPPVKPTSHCVLSCYAQTMRYWPSEEEIRELFFYKRLPVVEGMAVHYRGGDYLQLPGRYGTCKDAYYARMPDIKPRILYTDHGKGLPKPLRKIQRAEGDELEHFMEMGAYDNVFMGNSTFAWWAAFMGDCRNVWYPQSWYAGQDPPNSTRPVNPRWTEV